MAAEEPQPGGVSTPIPARAEFPVNPEALTRSSQSSVLRHEAQDGHGPPSKPSPRQQSDFRDVSACTEENMPSFPKEASMEGETEQEDLETEAGDAPEYQESGSPSPVDRQSRSLILPELWMERGHVGTTPGELELQLTPELTSLTLASHQAEEEVAVSPDPSLQARLGPSQEGQPAATCQLGDCDKASVRPVFKLQWTRSQESQEQEEACGLWQPGQEEMDLHREGTLEEDVCAEGVLGEQREEARHGPGGEQRQNKKQEQDGDGVVFAKLGERLNGEVDGGDDGKWAQGDLEQGHARERTGKGADEVEDAPQQEKQNLEGSSEKPSGKQETGLEGKEIQIAGKGEASGSMEVPETGARLQGVDRKEEEEEHVGPSTLPPGPPECSSPCEADCPRTEIPDIRTTPPMPEGQSPVMSLPPAQGRGGWTPPAMSLASSCSAGEPPSQETAPGSQAEGSELEQVALCGQETKLASACSPPLPPKMAESTPSGPQEAPLCMPTSSSARSCPVPIPLREPSPTVHSPETTRASLSAVSSSPYLASETPPSAVHGFLASEAFMDPWTLRQSPQNTDMGTVPHLRSNSFPGSHRTGSAPDLADTALSFSHSEMPQRPLQPASHDSSVPRRDRKTRAHDCVMSESHSLPTDLEQDPREFTSHLERPRSPHSSSPLNPAFIPHPLVYDSSPALVTVNSKNCPPHNPHSWEKRCSFPSATETDGQFSATVPTLKRCHHPAPLILSSRTHVSPRGPLPQAPDPLVARQLRPLPSTPDAPHHAQTSFSSKLRYNKPLPPTPDAPHHSSSSPSSSARMYKPLPPVPSEAPPLPPKTRGRSRSTLGGLLHPGGQPSPKPVRQEWTAASPHSAGRTSWPPASSRTTDTLVPPGRTKSEATSSLAFSNMTNLAMPSSPTTPWTQAELGSLEESETPASGRNLRKAAPQEVANGLRRSEVGRARPENRPSHPQLEKSSSWPHRRDPGRAREASTSGQSAVPGEGANKQKSWNRQGLRRPSILPESMADVKSPAVEKSPNPTDNIVFREKKPKEAKTGFSRRCSKLINSSQLLYQEYSDVVLNKEIQSQQRLDSIAEEPGSASPRQPRRGLVSSESYLQRLSMASSSSLWQEIPMVRNSTMLLSMTHSDQKLQEAKFELIVSEASYLRSLHIAVDHFQLSSQLRATLSNQEHQWLFSRLQEVREVSNTFLSDLEENFENNIFTFQVCDVVLSHAPNFRRVYLPYVTNQTYQERTFQNLLSNNSSFREVLEKLESDPVCQRLSLKSFLILPFQRITRLKLLLQNILKRTQPGSSEEAEATKAHHALEELIRACNSSVQKMHRTEELIHLSQKIEFECKIFPLISQSRWLVKSGELTALEFSVSPGFRRKLNTRPIHLHLFNDCLLLSRPREGSRFLVFDHAPFSAIRGEKCEMKLHGDHKNLFRLFLLHNTQGTQSEFLFSTETQSEKLRWLSALATPREELDLLECYDSPQVQCLRAYKPRENDELALEKADVVMVTQQSSDGWLEGMRLSDGERGWFPVQQVEFISNKEVCARNLKEAQRVKTAKLQLVEQQT